MRNVKLFCTPVGKDGNAIINPESALVCYLIKPKHEIGLEVLVTNEFGEQRLRVRKSSYLCVSSTMQIIDKKEK